MSPPRTCLEPGRRVRSARCVTADTHRTSFDRVAHCYDETRALPAEVMAAVVARIADELGPITSSPLLLEVGVGTGRIAVPLADAGVRVVGIDIAPAMLARLHGRRPGLPVLRADAARLPFRTATFVATLFVHVLHLLPDPAATLRAARRVTQPNGVLLYGRTDFTNAPLEPVAAIVRELVAELAGVELDPRSPRERAAGAFAADARVAGVELRETVVARWPVRMVGRRLLEDVAGRVWSSTWDIPDAVMPELIRRLTPRVEALVGDLDRPIDREATFTLTAAPCR